MSFIPLFKEKKLIEEDIFVNHPSFNFGRVIYHSYDVLVIEFLNGGIKRISNNKIGRFISKEVFTGMLSDYLFAQQFIKVKDKYGRIIETFSNKVIADIDDKKETLLIDFDSNLSQVTFDFALINESEYNNHFMEIEEQLKKENEKYIGIKVKHKKYGDGEVISCEKNKVEIKFEEKTTKFAIDYMLNFMEILNPNDKVKNIIISEKKDTIEVSIGDILKIPHFGRVFVLDVNDDTITVENIEVRPFGYNKSWLKEEYKLQQKDIHDYNKLTIVHNDAYGFCKLLGISEKGFDMIRISDNSLISLPLKYINLLENVENNIFIDLFNCNLKEIVEVNNIICTVIEYGKDSLELYSFVECENIKIRYSEIISIKKHEINYDEIKTYKGLIYAYGKNDYYKKKDLTKLCIDSFNYYPIDIGTKNIKNNINALIKKSGFVSIPKIDDVFLDKRYIDLENYVKTLMFKDDFVYYNEVFSSQYYDYLLNKMCKQHYCVQLYNGKYITLKKLSESGVILKTFDEFKLEVNRYLSKSVFVTINQIRINVNNILCKLLPDDSILINLIKSYDEFKTYKLGNKIIFSIKNDSARNESIENMFVTLLSNNDYTSIDVYDLKELINQYYDFDFTIETLLNEIKNFKILFYSKETERIYMNKEQFYKEIFE